MGKLLIDKSTATKGIQKYKFTYIFPHLLLMFLSVSCSSTAQTIEPDSIPKVEEKTSAISYELVVEIPVKGQHLAVDNLLNSYVASTEDELIKYSPEGKELYRYSNFDLGEISHIDVSNPFNILVFYQEFQIVEILDRTLDKTAEFDLFQVESPNIKAVCISSDQQIWVYDELNFKLKKLNTAGDVIFESANLSNRLESSFSPTFVIESGGNVYLNEASKPIYVFDLFGNFIEEKKLDVSIAQFQLIRDIFVYRNGDFFYFDNTQLGGLDTSILKMPPTKSKVIDALILKNRMIILEENQLSIYTFEKNSTE